MCGEFPPHAPPSLWLLGVPPPISPSYFWGKVYQLSNISKIWKCSQTASQAQHSVSRMALSSSRRMTQAKYSFHQQVHTLCTGVATSPMQQQPSSPRRCRQVANSRMSFRHSLTLLSSTMLMTKVHHKSALP